MTVQSTTSRADYTGNGSTTAFAVPFYFLDNSHLTVLRTQISTGAVTTLALTTDYTVSGAGVSAGGTVTMVTAPTADQKLSILRNVPLTQLIHYVPNDPFPAATHEQALDQLTMEMQQVNEIAGRALTLPANTASGTVSTSLPTPSSNKLIGWNSSATGLQNVDQATLATIVAFGTAKADIFSGTGSQTAFTLSANPGALANLDVSISGVTQRHGIDFTWTSGTTITFTSAPPSGTNNVLVRYLQGLPQGYTDSAASTFLQSGTGASSRFVQDKLREIVSVKDFGAVGDGVADDTTAIQSALNAATGSGLTIYVPKGTYKISATLSWPTNWPVALVGDGVEATHINYTGSSNAISMYDAGSTTKYIKSSIENLRLSGNGSTSINGVTVRQGYAIALRNVRIYNFQVGARIEQTWSVILDFVRIDNCSQAGLELHTEANNIACYGCEFLNNAKGIYTAGSRAILFSGCTLETNTQYGAYITANSADTQSENIAFHGCYIEGNGTNDIRVILDSGALNPQTVIVRDCYFVCLTSKASIAIRVDQADHVVIDGCDFSVGTATYAYPLYISDGGTVSKITFGKNRDTSTNGVYRGTGTAYSDQDKQQARAWGRFTISGGAIATTNSFGVSNITRISTGVYEITLREAMPSSNYGIIASAENGASYVAMLCSPAQPISTTVFRINTATDAATVAEARTVSFAVFA